MSITIKCRYCAKHLCILDRSRLSNVLHGHYASCSEYKSIVEMGKSFTVSGGKRNYGTMQSGSIVTEQFKQQFPEQVLQCGSDEDGENVVSLNDEAMEVYNSNSEDLLKFDIYDPVINDVYYLFQLSLYGKYCNDGTDPFKVGWITTSDGSNVKSTWEDYVIVNQFISKHFLSDQVGDDVLATFQLLLRRKNLCIPLPTSFRTIRRSIERSMSNDYYFDAMEIEYSSDVLSRVPNGKLPRGLSMNAIEVLAELLMNMNEDDIILCPPEGDSNYVTDFTTGTYFKELCAAVTSHFGDDVYPLCVDLNIDATDADGLHRRSLKPVVLRLKNVKVDLQNSKNLIFNVGYAPEHILSDDELLEFVIPSITSAAYRQEAVRYAKRCIQMDFMDKLMTPMTDTHACPITLCIGLPAPTTAPKKFVLFCSPFNNDNEEAYNLLNLHYRGRGCKCRVCSVSAINLNDPVVDIVSSLRDSSVLTVLQHRFTSVMIKEWTRPARRRLQPYFNDSELNILRRGKWYGLRPGFTSFYKHFDWVSNFGVGCLITSMTVDLMHTVYKGICEYVIRWTITCIYLICHKNRAVLGMLDNRLKESYVQQSLMPFNKKSIFSKGVSFMFKNTKTSPNALENSTMQGGGLEAQRVPDLLFQLMFAIGTEGRVVPNVNIEINDTYHCNPTKVILNACSAVCEMVWCLKTKSLHVNQFNDLLLIINVANFHALSLFDMKQALLNSNKTMKALKLHLTTHIPLFYIMYGPPVHNDTDLPEYTKHCDKVIFRSTSRRKDTALAEMAKKLKHGIRSDALFNRIRATYTASTTPPVPTQNHVEDEDVLFQISSIDNIKKTELLFNRSTGQWEYAATNIFPSTTRLHPITDLLRLSETLYDYSEYNDYNFELVSEMMKSPSPDCRVFLVPALKFGNATKSGIREFHIFATTKYTGHTNGRPSKHRFDAAEILLNTETKETGVCRVLGIIQICHASIEEYNTHLLLVTFLNDEEKKTSDKLLPYNFHSYNIRSANDDEYNFKLSRRPRLVTNIVEYDTIYRPCYLQPCPDRAAKFDAPFHVTSTTNTRMWTIPYKTVDRTGYEQTDDDSFLCQGQLDPLFLQNYSADDAVQQISRMMRNDTDSNEEDLDEDIMDDL